MAVFIDIPGIGNIEAKNAASEATLKEILKAMKAGNRGGGNTGGAATPGTAGGAGNPLTSMGKASGTATKALGKMTSAIGVAVGAAVKLSESTIGVIQAFSNIGDSVENAANVFSSIPIVGKMFGAVASASQKVNDSYLAAASGGAAFAGSMNQFVATATASGMTMEKFGQFVSQNGQAMLGLGATVEEGAKRFGQVSKGLRAVSGDLHALGFSTQEINQGLANYSRNLRLTGRQGTKSNDELVLGAKKYLKEMDLLAKVTGQSREEKEKELEQLKVDGQFSAAMAGLNEDVAASAEKLILSLPSKELQNLAKDIISTGTVSREGNRMLASQMPGLVSQLQGFHTQTQRNVQIADQQAISTLNNAKAEGKASQIRNKSALAGVEEMEGAAVGVASAARINTDAYRIASEEQQAAAEQTDNMNQQMQQAQQALASISNEFTMYLANSGVLQVMLDAFKGLVGFVRNYVVPAFTFLTDGIKTVWGWLNGSLTPVFIVMWNHLKEVSKVIFDFGKFLWNAVAPLKELAIVLFPAFVAASDFIADVFRKLGDFVQDFLRPVFDTVGRVINSVTSVIRDDFDPVLKSVSAWMDESFIKPFQGAVDWFNDKFNPAISFVTNLFNNIKTAINEWLAKWNSLSDIVDSIKLRFEGLQIALQKIVLWIDQKTSFRQATLDEIAKKQAEVAEAEAANLKAREELETRLAKQAQANLATQAANQARIDQERIERDEKIAYQRQLRDRQTAEWQNNTNRVIHNGAQSAMNVLKESNETAVDYTDSLALAKVEYTRTNPATAQADAARANLTNESQQQAAAAAAAAQQQTATSGGSGSGTPGQSPQQLPPRTQESSETLLANLNTKMDQLIRVQLQANSIFERQLTVQQSMTGDLFVAP